MDFSELKLPKINQRHLKNIQADSTSQGNNGKSTIDKVSPREIEIMPPDLQIKSSLTSPTKKNKVKQRKQSMSDE